MFEDMGFINTYKIDLHTLARSDGRTVKNCVYPSPAVQAERRLINRCMVTQKFKGDKLVKVLPLTVHRTKESNK